MKLRTGDADRMANEAFARRRTNELRPLSPEFQAMIGTPVEGKPRVPKAKKNKLVAKAQDRVAKEPRHVPSKDERSAFYLSWEWRTLRMLTLQRFGRRCQCCGATAQHLTLGGEPVRIVVDHIKPLGTHWHLRLDPDNTQVLCDDCNMGKGGRHVADFRT